MKIHLSWIYKKIGNPQVCICSNQEEARAITKFVKRYAKELEPCGFTEIEIEEKSLTHFGPTDVPRENAYQAYNG